MNFITAAHIECVGGPQNSSVTFALSFPKAMNFITAAHIECVGGPQNSSCDQFLDDRGALQYSAVSAQRVRSWLCLASVHLIPGPRSFSGVLRGRIMAARSCLSPRPAEIGKGRGRGMPKFSPSRSRRSPGVHVATAPAPPVQSATGGYRVRVLAYSGPGYWVAIAQEGIKQYLRVLGTNSLFMTCRLLWTVSRKLEQLEERCLWQSS